MLESGFSLLNARCCLQISAKILIFGVLFYLFKGIPVSRFLLALAVAIMFLLKLKKLTKNQAEI